MSVNSYRILKFVHNHFPSDAYDEIENCTLDTTLAEVKTMIRKEQGFEKGFDTVYLYHHLMGEQIQCPDSKTLRDIFGEQYVYV